MCGTGPPRVRHCERLVSLPRLKLSVADDLMRPMGADSATIASRASTVAANDSSIRASSARSRSTSTLMRSSLSSTAVRSSMARSSNTTRSASSFASPRWAMASSISNKSRSRRLRAHSPSMSLVPIGSSRSSRRDRIAAIASPIRTRRRSRSFMRASDFAHSASRTVMYMCTTDRTAASAASGSASVNRTTIISLNGGCSTSTLRLNAKIASASTAWRDLCHALRSIAAMSTRSLRMKSTCDETHRSNRWFHESSLSPPHLRTALGSIRITPTATYGGSGVNHTTPNAAINTTATAASMRQMSVQREIGLRLLNGESPAHPARFRLQRVVLAADGADADDRHRRTPYPSHPIGH